MANVTVALLGGLVLGAGIGAAVALLVRPTPESAPPPAGAVALRTATAGSEEGRAVTDTVRRGAEPHGAEPTPDAAGAEAPASREDAKLVSAQLLAFAESEIRRGWGEVRPDAVPDDVLRHLLESFEQTILTGPAGWGRSAAEARNVQDKKVDAFAGGDGVALLQVIDGREPEAGPFVASERFAQLFQPRGGGSVVVGPAYERGSKLPQGAVLSFPAGVFEVGDLARGNEPFPDDVTVRGVGMDATLLVLDAQSPHSPLRRFAIEDCTVFVENAITDVRSSPAVLALRRVRVLGFDCGAGGSVAFYLSGGEALLATGCRFEGGYGRAPQGYANLMSTHGPCLARFDQCLFDRISLSDAAKPAVVFTSCTMNELIDPAPAGPKFTNCRITVIDQAKRWDREFRARDLNTLFPQWRERMQRR